MKIVIITVVLLALLAFLFVGYIIATKKKEEMENQYQKMNKD